MNTQLDCLPCFIRQTLDVARRAGADEAAQEKILRHVLHWAGDMDMTMTPPAMGQRIHRLVRELTGNADPYAQAKAGFNHTLLELLPQFRAMIAGAPDPFAAAVRLAIAGNAIDLGAYSGLDDRHLQEQLIEALTTPVAGALEDLRQTAEQARSILYIADNAGEIMLDRLLIELLGPRRITLAVRGQPILNDATRADAAAAGLDTLVQVIDNGSDAPGTILEECSPELRRHFQEADLIIAKGQGNYETLSAVRRERLFFLLMAKCPLIARHLACELRDFVIARPDA